MSGGVFFRRGLGTDYQIAVPMHFVVAAPLVDEQCTNSASNRFNAVV